MPKKLTYDQLLVERNRAGARGADLMEQIRNLKDDEKRLTNLSAVHQLQVLQLESQRDVLIAALADCQHRVHVLRHKSRPCNCGSAVSEDKDDSGLTLTDRAAGML